MLLAADFQQLGHGIDTDISLSDYRDGASDGWRFMYEHGRPRDR